MKIADIEARGLFWWASEHIPSGGHAPASAVHGCLQIGALGPVKILLDGQLFRGSCHQVDDPGSPSINAIDNVIVGILENNQNYVRIENPRLLEEKFWAKYPATQSFRADNCLFGKNLENGPANAPIYTAIRISLVGLEDWLQFHPPEMDEDKDAIRIVWKKFGAIQYNIECGRVRIECSYVQKRRLSSEISVRPFLYLELKTPMSLQEAENLVVKIQEFFILVTYIELDLERPSVMSVSSEGWDDLHFTSSLRLSETLSRERLWTTFSQLRERLGQMLNTWFKKSLEYGPGFHLYLGNRRGMQLYIEHRFINLIWGIESLHSITGKQKSVIKNQLKNSRIISSANNSDRDHLRRVLPDPDSMSLADRISEKIRSLGLKLSNDEISKFSGRCAYNRNLISHKGGVNYGRPYTDFVDDINILTAALEPLYHAIIVRELGFSAEEISTIFNKGPRGAWLTRTLSDAGLMLVNKTK